MNKLDAQKLADDKKLAKELEPGGIFAYIQKT